MSRRAICALALSALSSCSSYVPQPQPEPLGSPPSAVLRGDPFASPATPVDGACSPFDAAPRQDRIKLELISPLFTEPVVATKVPGDPSHWLVGQLNKVMRFAPGDATAEEVGDFSASGFLLGMTLHPRFAENGQIFVYFTQPVSDIGHLIYVSRFDWDPAAGRFDPTEHRLLTFMQPEAYHMGGNLLFGPDGFLYIGTGEGGGEVPSEDPQDEYSYQGKILRIDVDHADPVRGTPYAIPPGNPFHDADGWAEVYAMGFRNPWRWSFDRLNGDLWVGDVGDTTFEEIDIVRAGANYGWPHMEGPRCHAGEACDSSLYAQPVSFYDRSGPQAGGASVTGGYVYRGSRFPELVGQYLFGDWISGRISLASPASGGELELLLARPGLQPVAFAEDEGGELYVLDYAGGGLHAIVPAEVVLPTGPRPAPTSLSATGCFNPGAPVQPVRSLVPYSVNAPLWSDDADKRRFLSLPPGQKVHLESDGRLTFPAGTVLLKQFAYGERMLETRFFMLHDDGSWSGSTWAWNATGTDATLVREGLELDDGRAGFWHVPSETQCMTCHNAEAGSVLGFTLQQLDAATLARWDEFLDAPPPHVAPLVSLHADGSSEEKARSYLQANCAHCHQGDGPGRATIDLRSGTPFAQMGLCDARPNATTELITDGLLLAPGAPERSVLLARMKSTGQERMPALGSRFVDEEAVRTVEAWISNLQTCP